jgi:hypothetical protein
VDTQPARVGARTGVRGDPSHTHDTHAHLHAASRAAAKKLVQRESALMAMKDLAPVPTRPVATAIEADLARAGLIRDLQGDMGVNKEGVGVILNLAMFFAYHVLWPQGFGGRFDGVSAAIALGAAVALFRFKVGVLPLLGACAVAGLVVTGLRTLSLF